MLGLVKCLHLNLIKQSKALKKFHYLLQHKQNWTLNSCFFTCFTKSLVLNCNIKTALYFVPEIKCFSWILSCKLVQSQICSNRAIKFVTWSLVHEAEVLSLLESLIVCGLPGPAWRVSPRGVLPRNDGRVASTPIVCSVLLCFLSLFNLFFLGLWVLGAFALALVGWTSCDEFKPKKKKRADLSLSVIVQGEPHCYHPTQRVSVYL